MTRRELTTRAVSLALGLGVSLVSLAEAQAAPVIPTRLVWHGTVCGTADDFAARVAQRTTAVRFVRRGQQLAVRLRIQRSGSGLDARVSIEARGKAPMVRHIESPDCEDALDALALVVAIGVEARAADTPVAPRARRRAPSASAQPAPPPPPVAPEPPSAAPPEPTPAPTAPGEREPAAPASEPPAVAEMPPVVLPPVAAAEPPPAFVPAAPSSLSPGKDPGRAGETATRAAPLDVSVGLAAQMSGGIAPDPMIGGGVWLSAGWGSGVWSPELGLRGVHQRLDGFRSTRGAVDFSLNALTLALCPLRWGSDRLSLRPCVAGTLGRLAAQPYDTFDPRSRADLHGALGTSIDALARAGIVELRAQLGVGAPLSRDKYGFGTGCAGSACEADVFHRVGPVIWSGALGAGVRVW